MTESSYFPIYFIHMRLFIHFRFLRFILARMLFIFWCVLEVCARDPF